MKTDYSFKLVAAIIVAGVIVALSSPSHGGHATPTASVAPEAAPVVHLAE